MKSLLESHKALLLLTLCGCISQPPPKVAISELKAPSETSLESEEYKYSKSPEIKIKLGRAQWCRHQRGMAFENWLWIKQFAQNSPQYSTAKTYLELAKSDPSLLDVELNCPRK